MAIHIMENFVSIEDYGRLCGKKRRAIMDRIKAKSISAIKVDGYIAINTVTNPPKMRVYHSKIKPGGGVHVVHTELRCVITWCWGKKIRPYPFLRAIINGKLNGTLIGDEVFATLTDLEAFLKNPA